MAMMNASRVEGEVEEEESFVKNIKNASWQLKKQQQQQPKKH